MTLLHIIRKLNVLRVYNKSVTYHTVIFTTVTGNMHHILLESNRNLIIALKFSFEMSNHFFVYGDKIEEGSCRAISGNNICY